MFSAHINKTDEFSFKPLLFVVATLAIVCLLAAMVMVVGGQVEKAQMREASLASERAVKVGCIESSRGVALKDCERQSMSFAAQADVDQATPTRRGDTLFTLVNRY